MDIVIVVYSFTGNNALLARRLGDRMHARIVTVAEDRWLPRTKVTVALDFFLKRKARIRPLPYIPRATDHVLFLAPLYDMWIAQPGREAVVQLASRLGSYSFASFCGFDRPGQADHVRSELTTLVGKPPAEVWQLFVADLFPPEKRERVSLVSNHRVTESEMDQYAAKLDAICRWFEDRGAMAAH